MSFSHLKYFYKITTDVDPAAIKMLGLTTSQFVLLCFILERQFADHGQIFEHLYAHDPNGGPDTADKCVQVLICHVRKKIRPYGARIENLFGRGYYMEPQSKAIVQNLLEGGAKNVA